MCLTVTTSKNEAQVEEAAAATRGAGNNPLLLGSSGSTSGTSSLRWTGSGPGLSRVATLPAQLSVTNNSKMRNTTKHLAHLMCTVE